MVRKSKRGTFSGVSLPNHITIFKKFIYIIIYTLVLMKQNKLTSEHCFAILISLYCKFTFLSGLNDCEDMKLVVPTHVVLFHQHASIIALLAYIEHFSVKKFIISSALYIYIYIYIYIYCIYYIYYYLLFIICIYIIYTIYIYIYIYIFTWISFIISCLLFYLFYVPELWSI